MNNSKIFSVILFSILHFNVLIAQDSIQTKESTTQLFKSDIKLGGRIHYDFEFLSQKDGIATGVDYSLQGQEFRSVVLNASGALSKNIKFKVEFDFANSKISYRDVYIKFLSIPIVGGNIMLGSQAEPSGLELLTGANVVIFKEKTPLSSTQNFRWNSGIGYENFSFLKGKLGFQMTYSFNGKNAEGFLDSDLKNGAHFVARLTSPIFENSAEKQMLHIGINYENRKYTKDPANFILKFRPENHMGQQVSIPFSNLKFQEDFGFEVAFKWNSLSFHSEYENAGYHTVLDDFRVNSYYGLVSFFLTGDHRNYKDGVFGRVNPKQNFNFENKTFGALEVVTRFSGIDYSQVIITGNNDSVHSLGFGLNWYSNSNARLMYNYIISDYNKTGLNYLLNAHSFRAQVDF